MAKSIFQRVAEFFKYIWLVIVQLVLVLGQIFLAAWPIVLLLLGLFFLGRFLCNSAVLVTTFLDTFFNTFIVAFNIIATAWNAVGLVIPSLFTFWNIICRILLQLINFLGMTYCTVWPTTNPLVDCSPPATIVAFIWDIICFFVDILGIPFGFVAALLAAISSVVCDPAIASIIGYTVPASCPSLTIKDILMWIFELIMWLVGVLSSVAEAIRVFVETYSGEFGLRAITAGTAPHFLGAGLPSTTGLLSILFRLVTIPEVGANIFVGLFLNTVVAIPDLLLCSLGLTIPPGPLNFIGCIIIGGGGAPGSPCFTLLSAVPVFIPIIGVVVLDLSGICFLLPAFCPCFACTNPWIGPAIKVPCVIGPTCASCVSTDTIFDLFGALFVLFFPSLAAPIVPPGTPPGIQNQIFV